MWCWLNFDGVGLEGRRELRPLLGRLGREQGRQELATSASPTQEGRRDGGALNFCGSIPHFSPPSSVLLLSFNRLPGGPNDRTVLR